MKGTKSTSWVINVNIYKDVQQTKMKSVLIYNYVNKLTVCILSANFWG